MIEFEKPFEDFTDTGIELTVVPASTVHECHAPEVIARLGLPLLRVIAQITSSQVIYPALAKLKGDDFLGLERQLLAVESRAEKSFWLMVSQFRDFLDNGGIEILQAEGCEFRNGEDESAYLARIYFDQPQKLQQVIGDMPNRITGDIAGKSIHIFESLLAPDELTKRQAQLNEDAIRSGLTSPFQKKGYGDFCEIAAIGKPVGYVVNRGTRRAANAVLDAEETRKFRHDRKVKTDSMFYSPETNSLVVQCQSKADAVLYADVIGRALGDAAIFSRRKSFDMSSLLEEGLDALLVSAAREIQVVRVELRKVRIKIAEGGTTNYAARRGEPCLSHEYHKVPSIHPTNELLFARLRIVKSPDGKDYVDLDVTPEGLKIGSGLDPLGASKLLVAIGAWKAHANC